MLLEQGKLLCGGDAALAGIEGGAQCILDLAGMAWGPLLQGQAVIPVAVVGTTDAQGIAVVVGGAAEYGGQCGQRRRGGFMRARNECRLAPR